MEENILAIIDDVFIAVSDFIEYVTYKREEYAETIGATPNESAVSWTNKCVKLRAICAAGTFVGFLIYILFIIM